MEKILIENFGPIKKAEIEVKKINILIGTTSSGKSTVAKLISIFRDDIFEKNTSYARFRKTLEEYNIDFKITDNTLIKYDRDELSCIITKKHIELSSEIEDQRSSLNPIYVPAERIFFPTISQSIFGLMSSKISLPKWFLDFGAQFEKARNTIKKLPINFLKVSYEYDGRQDFVELENKQTVRLSQASSGLQSVIPLILVTQYNTSLKEGVRSMFVIEEPELNLYPSSQKDLTEFIIGAIRNSADKLIITTHSPYLLTTLDNLIQAGNVVKLNPDLKTAVSKIVPEEYWIDYNDVSCYFFSNGTAKSTLDPETESIGPSNIDNVSEQLSETFEKLLALKYQDS